MVGGKESIQVTAGDGYSFGFARASGGKDDVGIFLFCRMEDVFCGMERGGVLCLLYFGGTYQFQIPGVEVQDMDILGMQHEANACRVDNSVVPLYKERKIDLTDGKIRLKK